MAATLMFWRAPPLKMFRKPRTVLSRKRASSARGLIPGTGRLETKRNSTSSANVKISFSRMSGWDIALMAACSSCGRCWVLAAVATGDLHCRSARGLYLLFRRQRELVRIDCEGLLQLARGPHLDRAAQAAGNAGF